MRTVHTCARARVLACVCMHERVRVQEKEKAREREKEREKEKSPLDWCIVFIDKVAPPPCIVLLCVAGEYLVSTPGVPRRSSAR